MRRIHVVPSDARQFCKKMPTLPETDTKDLMHAGGAKIWKIWQLCHGQISQMGNSKVENGHLEGMSERLRRSKAVQRVHVEERYEKPNLVWECEKMPALVNLHIQDRISKSCFRIDGLSPHGRAQFM